MTSLYYRMGRIKAASDLNIDDNLVEPKNTGIDAMTRGGFVGGVTGTLLGAPTVAADFLVQTKLDAEDIIRRNEQRLPRDKLPLITRKDYSRAARIGALTGGSLGALGGGILGTGIGFLKGKLENRNTEHGTNKS
jgi:hypothetical protein